MVNPLFLGVNKKADLKFLRTSLRKHSKDVPYVKINEKDVILRSEYLDDECESATSEYLDATSLMKKLEIPNLSQYILVRPLLL